MKFNYLRFELRPGSIELRPGSIELRPGSIELRPGSIELRPGSIELRPGSTSLILKIDTRLARLQVFTHLTLADVDAVAPISLLTRRALKRYLLV